MGVNGQNTFIYQGLGSVAISGIITDTPGNILEVFHMKTNL